MSLTLIGDWYKSHIPRFSHETQPVYEAWDGDAVQLNCFRSHIFGFCERFGRMLLLKFM